MKSCEFIKVDLATLHLPGSRRQGADPAKLRRQLNQYGGVIRAMPPLEVQRGLDSELVIFDGVTRATRAEKYCSGTLITAEVTGSLNYQVGKLSTVGEK
jgi:hypothetical protein